jgi:hypothetical protein
MSPHGGISGLVYGRHYGRIGDGIPTGDDQFAGGSAHLDMLDAAEGSDFLADRHLAVTACHPGDAYSAVAIGVFLLMGTIGQLTPFRKPGQVRLCVSCRRSGPGT